MVKNNNQGLLIIAIFGAFLCQGSPSVLGSGINTVAQAFPDVPLATVMSMNTLPSFFLIFAALISGRLAGDKVKYRTLVLGGLLFIIVGGLLPIILSNFTLILACRALVGFGAGMLYPLGPVLVVRLFEENKAGHVMGFANIFATGGGMLMQIFCGILAVMSWRYIFAVHLLAVIAFIVVFIGLKEPEKVEKVEAAPKVSIFKMPFRIYFNFIVTMLFMVLSFPLFLSVSTIVDVRHLGTAAQAGVALTLFNVGGMALSALFGNIYKLLKKWTLIGVLLITILSMVIVSQASSFWMLCIGTLLFGSGLLLLPVLIIENGQVLPAEQVSFASGMMVAGMNIGSFLSSYVIAIIFAIVGNENIAAPLYFSIISLSVITVLLALIRIKKDKNEDVTAQV